MPPERHPFSSFNGLTQVIHQSEQRFVLISYTNEEESASLKENLPPIEGLGEPEEGEHCVFFEVGEISTNHLWWRGFWTLKDVKKLSRKPKPSSEEIIKLATEKFSEGFLSVGGLPGDRLDSQTQSRTQTHTPSQTSTHVEPKPFLRIDSVTPSAPLQIPLEALPHEAAAIRAAEVLFSISCLVSANQASRFLTSGSDDSETRALQEKVLEYQQTLVEQEQRIAAAETIKHVTKDDVPPPPVTAPGRSLGNPSKKARKVQKVEFDDSDEEASQTRKKKRRE